MVHGIHLTRLTGEGNYPYVAEKLAYQSKENKRWLRWFFSVFCVPVYCSPGVDVTSFTWHTISPGIIPITIIMATIVTPVTTVTRRDIPATTIIESGSRQTLQHHTRREKDSEVFGAPSLRRESTPHPPPGEQPAY